MLIKRSFILSHLLLSFFILSSCQTTPKPYEGPLPKQLLNQFAACEGQDGEIDVMVKDLDKTLANFSLEWVSYQNRNWVAEHSSSFGNTIFSVLYDDEKKQLKAKGLGLEKKKLSVDADGFLLASGYRLPILAEEVPCFFSLKWPKSWLKQVQLVSKSRGSLQLYFKWVHREAVMTYQRGRSCLETDIPYFLGILNKKLTICLEKSDLTMSGLDRYQLGFSTSERR